MQWGGGTFSRKRYTVQCYLRYERWVGVNFQKSVTQHLNGFHNLRGITQLSGDGIILKNTLIENIIFIFDKYYIL